MDFIGFLIHPWLSLVRLVRNISEASPSWVVAGLEGGTTYLLKVFASNSKGASSRRTLQGYTLRDVAERRTAQVGVALLQGNPNNPTKNSVIVFLFHLYSLQSSSIPQVRPPPEELAASYRPIIAVVVAVLGSCLLVLVTSCLVVSLKRKKRRGVAASKAAPLPLQTVLDPSLDDKNPDVIPNNGEDDI